MLNRLTGRLGKWLVTVFMVGLAGLLAVGFSAASAQTEPTMNDVYQMAQSGKVAQAQTMIQQVLVMHPNSAKAHFVQAELYGRQGQATRGRDALAAAEKLAPGLPFAKPEAVQALRAQLAAKSSGAAAQNLPAQSVGSPDFGASTPPAVTAAPAKSSFPLGLGLALGGAAIALVIYLTRKKATPGDSFSSGDFSNPNAVAVNPAMSGGIGSGLSGPQTFGNNVNPASAYGQNGNPQPSNPYTASGQPQQPAYGAQPAPGSGMGGRVMGGLATGLAVGAGVLAAQAICKNLMGNAHASSQPGAGASDLEGQSLRPLPGNDDMGGQNFGINDSSSWDDGGSSMSDAGGGDWDS